MTVSLNQRQEQQQTTVQLGHQDNGFLAYSSSRKKKKKIQH